MTAASTQPVKRYFTRNELTALLTLEGDGSTSRTYEMLKAVGSEWTTPEDRDETEFLRHLSAVAGVSDHGRLFAENGDEAELSAIVAALQEPERLDYPQERGAYIAPTPRRRRARPSGTSNDPIDINTLQGSEDVVELDSKDETVGSEAASEDDALNSSLEAWLHEGDEVRYISDDNEDGVLSTSSERLDDTHAASLNVSGVSAEDCLEDDFDLTAAISEARGERAIKEAQDNSEYKDEIGREQDKEEREEVTDDGASENSEDGLFDDASDIEHSSPLVSPVYTADSDDEMDEYARLMRLGVPLTPAPASTPLVDVVPVEPSFDRAMAYRSPITFASPPPEKSSYALVQAFVSPSNTPDKRGLMRALFQDEHKEEEEEREENSTDEVEHSLLSDNEYFSVAEISSDDENGLSNNCEGAGSSIDDCESDADEHSLDVDLSGDFNIDTEGLTNLAREKRARRLRKKAANEVEASARLLRSCEQEHFLEEVSDSDSDSRDTGRCGENHAESRGEESASDEASESEENTPLLDQYSYEEENDDHAAFKTPSKATVYIDVSSDNESEDEAVGERLEIRSPVSGVVSIVPYTPLPKAFRRQFEAPTPAKMSVPPTPLGKNAVVTPPARKGTFGKDSQPIAYLFFSPASGRSPGSQ